MNYAALDWDGTITAPEAVDEVVMRIFETLGISMGKEQLIEKQKTNAHFHDIQQRIAEYTGQKDKRYLTVMMTELFRLHYLAVAKERRTGILNPAMHETLAHLSENGTRLIIVTSSRADIIQPVLELLSMEDLFSAVYANTPDLTRSKHNLLLNALGQYRRIDYMIGDREEDLSAGKAVKAKTGFASWGHGELVNKSLADAILQHPTDLYHFTKTL
jgi:phosphoglycolate phosphatase-like HAD superfamily hydrolase